MLHVERAGLLTTVQDQGRPGFAHLGVSRSGAVDPASLRLANRLVGNPEAAAGIETTLLGADLRLSASRWVAVTGAGCEVRIDDRAAGCDAPQFVPAGSVLSIGAARWGVRSYLAVSGGIAVPPVLGSRSTDTLSGIGPAPLAAGDALPLLPVPGPPASVDVAPRPTAPEILRVRLLKGPRDQWFTDASLHDLVSRPYVIAAEADRVGARLNGPALQRCDNTVLPSEGVVLGAVQVPPSGLPITFLADHPTTGGYPVVGVLHPADVWLMAQARPGTEVRFRWHPSNRSRQAV
jgi:biotin-dependent carboxylase-like uncharacterized protein